MAVDTFNFVCIMIKRTFDIFFSFILLLILSPLIIITYILVRVEMGSPVIFCQQRPGYKEKTFKLYKYRTMSDKRDEFGQQLPDADRVTYLGKMLRKYSLDELPQLFNVLKGDLSIVGPRPLLVEYLPLYNKQQARRHNVKPGITGWAQVNGRNELSWEDNFKLDTWYVDNQSLILDIKIILMTILQVISGKGINNPGREDVECFKGNRIE